MFHKELNDRRKARWSKAFVQVSDNNDGAKVDEGKEAGTNQEEAKSSSNDFSLRATIVIEHIAQASDVSHKMQHWHVCRKWVRFVCMV
jgi:hypothetical protein